MGRTAGQGTIVSPETVGMNPLAFNPFVKDHPAATFGIDQFAVSSLPRHGYFQVLKFPAAPVGECQG